jgi:CheY-like chemotaxis protein
VRGSIGQLLIQQGVIDSSALQDGLARQSGRHPLASELYVLGHASERSLAMALSMQTGWPAVVLDESTLDLGLLAYVSLEWARIFSAIVVHEDATTIVVAAARPEDAIVPARELATSHGKHVELRIVLDVTLARTIRVAFQRLRAGERWLMGPEARHATSFLASVAPDTGEVADEHRQAQRALAEEAARSIESKDELPSEELASASMTLGGADWQNSTITTMTVPSEELVEEQTVVISDKLDAGGPAASTRSDRTRALVIDPDPPGRIRLVSELERLGVECQAASSGDQAVELLTQLMFDLVFADIATDELDGLRLCRALKRSQRFARCRVVITTSVVDSGQVSDQTLQQHGADGYLEKPFDPRRLHRLLRDLIDDKPDHEVVLADALGRYHDGDVDGAINRLRGALVNDPSSPKLHFMLANMLQRASRWPEAVDEYEAVVELQPVYFPALTRLAYLYFRQGLHARAVETWRRALPVCDDPALRRNIELFMRKLVADMKQASSPPD